MFYLGCPEPSWIRRTSVPLFISRTRLGRLATLPAARGPWALDSGGFSELDLHGRWTVSPKAYVAEVRRYVDQLGEPDFIAVQDWMCEDDQLRDTGRPLHEHLMWSALSYATLRDLAPDLPWLPTLQGVRQCDYLWCAEIFDAMGVDLVAAPRVGVGSVCRRQPTVGAALLFDRLVDELGLRNLHAFGFKADGLALCGERIASADSLAWSQDARRVGNRGDGPACPEGKTDCRNCLHHALAWRSRTVARWEARRAEVADAVVCPVLRPRREPLQSALFAV